jgi:hypothetical protein
VKTTISRLMLAASLILVTFLASRCSAPDHNGATAAGDASNTSLAAWETVYAVLQHPRCSNCHPAGDVPLQGERQLPHPQNVQRGKDGHGLFAMRCDTCHQDENVAGLHMPPGAPGWHLPPADMPMVFVGRSSSELCRQLKDPKQNGGKTLEQIYEHIAHDALVGWGWSPGDGRAPVPIPRDELARATRAWIDGGCACP